MDLRSDTLTRPTDGDACGRWRTPRSATTSTARTRTVGALEERVAGLFGHEAAVFVPSGTMGNQICLQLVVPPGEELLCGSEDHVVTYEHGGGGGCTAASRAGRSRAPAGC